MSQRTPKSPSAPPTTEPRPKFEADVTAPDDLESETVPQGIDGVVETLADLRTEALLSALQASSCSPKKGTNMAERRLTAEAAMEKVRALRKDVKECLGNEEKQALNDVAGIRAEVKVKELQKFDDMLDALVNSPP
jgi:hypothetical protein